MADRAVSVLGFVALVGMLVGGCASEGTMGSTGAGASGQASPLDVCLAGISSSASAGTKQVAEESCRRDSSVRMSIIGAATAKSNDRAASGTPGDSLDACMGRIPKDASVGQKMLAEESCKRDQATRR
ncbi:MAG: hypothetical protein Q8L74_00610 [Nitrospirota bacterium]|nr:hypothetical protein [Nitrospirota bacterium]MDP2382126.1 hypothetical protein [Nitrospirota bacterium]MDP3596061.1 hypothetical protein [Nitrospirota bacterium]